jgi:hypothetical protein
MINKELYNQIVKLHSDFEYIEYDILELLGEDIINDFIRNNFDSLLIYYKAMLSIRLSTNPSKMYSYNYIASLLIKRYNLNIDFIIFSVNIVHICIEKKIYSNNFDSDHFKPINGWYEELYSNDVILYLNPKKYKYKYYMRLLEYFIIFMSNFHIMSYDYLLNSTFYFIISELKLIEKNEIYLK